MSNEIKDQRIGMLRGALVATRDGMSRYAGFEHFVRQIDDVLKADAAMADQVLATTGEQIQELAVLHRARALDLLRPVLSWPGVEEFVENIIAAAGYEAEARMRLRSGRK